MQHWTTATVLQNNLSLSLSHILSLIYMEPSMEDQNSPSKSLDYKAQI